MKPTTRTLILCTTAAGLLAGTLVISAKSPTPPASDCPGGRDCPVSSAQPTRPPAPPAKPTRVQLAILLDTSSSMDGLIDQAKTQLWRIVNEFGAARRDGQRPELEIALYEYGKSSLPAGEGFIRMILPLTRDLDRVSEQLFALTTNGGDEYCGQVIQAATEGLAWSSAPEDLKFIFIAGNEPFTQGHVDFKKAIHAASARGIVVNTVHCGNETDGVQGGWRDAAVLADGRFTSIDQNQAIVHVRAPQDEEIERLGAQINTTYVPFGATGAESQARQVVQDGNASQKGSLALRSVSKASRLYKNTGWDLVDALDDGKVQVEKLKESELPAEMQKLDLAGKKAYVAGRAKERARIQQRIAELNEARKTYVTEEMKKQGAAATLDTAVVDMVRSQASKKGYRFE